jgi:WhiB family redox-sensing transcriptional regulator
MSDVPGTLVTTRRSLDTAWMADAACRWYDPEIFFPAAAPYHARNAATPAIEVCSGCPVQTACLNWCLTFEMSQHLLAGVWGGQTESQRERLRTQRRSGPYVPRGRPKRTEGTR